MKVNMTPNPLDVVTIHASQGDTEARQWEFELHNNGELIDTSNVTEQMFFKAYKGGTEQILPENTSTPTTSPFKGDIRYPQGLLTDQKFTYRQSPTEEDGLAKITDIKGNTLVWNQQIPIPVKASAITSNITVTNNRDGSLTLNGTPSNMNINWWIWGDYATNVSILSLKASHKYFVKDCNLYRETGAELLTQYIGASPVIWSPSTDYELGGVRVPHGDTNKTYTNVKIYPMIIDLTQMGLDSITSANEFISLFPLPYYSYNQGTLLSFNGNGIKTVGANFISSVEQGTIDPWSVEGSANPAPSNTRVRTPFIYLEKGDYTITSQNGFNTVIDIYRSNAYNTYDIDVSFPSWQTTPKTFTMPYDGYAIILFRRNDNTDIHPSDITGERMYNNNTESTTNLPTSTYFPNGMKSKGDVYDELTETKAITRIGSRAYQSGDESDTSVITDGTTTYYALATPTETSFTTASLVTENAEIPLSNNDGTLIGKCTEQLSENPGFIDAKIKLADADGECYSNKIQLHIERSPQ